MEGLLIDYEYEPGQVFNITPYSDLHDDAVACDRDGMLAHMTRRAKMDNAVFLGLGDIGNWIFDGKDRRNTPSTPDPAIAGYDDYIDRHVKRQIEWYREYPWAFIGIGNHETAIIKYHHTDPVRRVCESLNIPYGGYCGMARLRFTRKGGKAAGADCSVNILYHHGAWGGKVQKGFGGARDWARAFDGWDMFCYGHNHQENIHREPRLHMTDRGKIVHRDVFFVNTGTFQRGCTQGDFASYAEIRGYAPTVLGTPLIQVQPGGNLKISVKTGDDIVAGDTGLAINRMAA